MKFCDVRMHNTVREVMTIVFLNYVHDVEYKCKNSFSVVSFVQPHKVFDY